VPYLKPLVLLGPPGCGKGTQCVKLVDLFGYVRVATGDLIRNEIASQTPLGQSVSALLDSGELVSDAIVCQMVSSFLAIPRSSPMFLFDGFPRTLAQAQHVFLSVDSSPLESFVVANISVPVDVVVSRILSRLVCNHCAYVFSATHHNLKAGLICPKCKDGHLSFRSDDSESVVRRRYKIFSQENEGLLRFFGDRVVTIDGNQSQEHVFDDILRLICK